MLTFFVDQAMLVSFFCFQLAYVRELFDYYAPSYDDHMRKKLLYTAPRILRQVGARRHHRHSYNMKSTNSTCSISISALVPAPCFRDIKVSASLLWPLSEVVHVMCGSCE